MKKYTYPFLFGFYGGLAFPPLYLIFLLPFSFFYLLRNLNELDWKCILMFCFAYFLPQFYWTAFSILVERQFLWLFPIGVLFVPFASGLFFFVAILIFKKINISNKFLYTVVFSALYVFFEYLRGLIFPWNFVAYTLAFSDTLIQIDSIFGIYIFDFLMVIFYCFYYVLEDFEKEKLYSIFYGGFFLFILGFGIIRLHNAETTKFNHSISIVQANIKQEEKLDTEAKFNNLKKHIDLSDEDSEIVIWSEASFPFVLRTTNELKANFEKFKDKILIFGAVRTEDNIDIFNSIFVFKNNKVLDIYDKVKLVPFGEFVPLPFVEDIFGIGSFSRGNGNKTIKLFDDLKISPVICYEIGFPHNIIDKNDRPDVIINLTNDAWFGNTSGPYQHLVSAKFRALEYKIPVIRIANTGISAYINEYGIVEQKIELNKSGILKF